MDLQLQGKLGTVSGEEHVRKTYVMDSTADNSIVALSSPAGGAASSKVVRCEGVAFTVTEGDDVAQVGWGGAARVLGSESFLDAATGQRHHFVDVQGKAEAMLFLVSVREDQRRIVAVRRFF